MLIPVVLVPVAFAVGVYLARRFAPPLRETRVGIVAARATELLLGAAAAALALNVYLAIRVTTADEYEGFSRGEAVAYALADALWQSGLLLAAAVVVHFLAPGEEDELDR